MEVDWRRLKVGFNKWLVNFNVAITRPALRAALLLGVRVPVLDQVFDQSVAHLVRRFLAGSLEDHFGHPAKCVVDVDLFSGRGLQILHAFLLGERLSVFDADGALLFEVALVSDENF